MARISTRNLIDGGERVTPPTTVKPTVTPAPTTSTATDPYYVRDPKTGLSPAQVEANKAVAAAATATGMQVTSGATGPQATSNRVSTTPVTTKQTTGKKIIGYVQWTNPTNGATYNVPQYDDGTTALTEWSGGATVPQSFMLSSGTNKGGGSTGGAPQRGGDAEADALVAFNKAQAEAATKATRESAFALLKLEFDKYGLGSLVDTVKSYIMQGSPVEEVTLKLRATPEYEARFAGNKERLKAGLNVYDEATYIQLENAYDQVFTSYGVMEAAGNTREARRARYAQFIGGTISPDEVKSRVQLAVAAANEDEVTKATLKELYPSISDKDIVSYFLNPKETLPKLETKIRASQIGAAAVRQGLVTNVATAEELAAMGITEQEAERAYSAYAGMKPTLDKLTGLEADQELAVNQQVAEGALLKGLASEQRKLEALRQKEIARFGGSSGTARGVSLGGQTGGTY